MEAVFAKAVYTGDSVVKNAYVCFEDGVVKGVFQEKPKSAEVLAEGEAVTPALIDAHSHIGMARSGEPVAEEDINDRFDSIIPHADALNAVYMDDKAFSESIEFGVLYSCVMPGSGNIIGGKAAVIKNYARDVEEAFIKYAGVKAALGYNPKSTHEWKGERPHTRMGVSALLEEFIKKALDAKKMISSGKKDEAEFDPRLREFFPVVDGNEVLRVHAHKVDDIVYALGLSKRYGLKVVVEHASDVNTTHVFEKLRDAGVPVVYGPLDAFSYKTELKHESYRNVRYLIEAKPLYGLMSDHPVTLQRNLFLQLRFFLRYGLSKPECVAVVTKNNAQILGVDGFLGTIEPGKWASFVVWSGDPFSMESRPTHVFAEGKLVFSE